MMRVSCRVLRVPINGAKIDLKVRRLILNYNCKDINYEPKQELAKITPHGVVPQNA